MTLARRLVVQPGAIDRCRSDAHATYSTRRRCRLRPPRWRGQRSRSQALSRVHSLAHRVPALLLKGVKSGVEAVGRDKLFVGAALGNPAIFDDEYPVHVPDQPEFVGDNEGSAAFGQYAPALLYRFGGLGVEAGLGLVENQNRGVPQHRPGDRDALT